MEGSLREDEEVPVLETVNDKYPSLPLRLIPPEEVRPFENAVPVYDLKIAAGQFSDEQAIAEATGSNITNPGITTG